MALSTIQEELLRLLDQNAGFRQQVRQRVLSAELIELPEQFASFASHVNEFVTEQRETNARMDEFVTEQREINARLDEFVTEQREINARMGKFVTEQRETNARMGKFVIEQRETNARMDARLKNLTDDIGILKGSVVGRVTRDHVETILGLLDLEYVNILMRRDLVAMLGRATDIPTGYRQSFYRADLMLQAVDADGATHYVATEASYTADRRDTDRALRNAGFLTRCTGCPAHAVISSVKNDREVQALVEAGTVHWYRLTKRDLEPE